jgi:hypothetical protein
VVSGTEKLGATSVTGIPVPVAVGVPAAVDPGAEMMDRTLVELAAP